MHFVCIFYFLFHYNKEISQAEIRPSFCAEIYSDKYRVALMDTTLDEYISSGQQRSFCFSSRGDGNYLFAMFGP